jgi:hypothetical protein
LLQDHLLYFKNPMKFLRKGETHFIFLEALQWVAIVGGLEKILRDLWRAISPTILTHIVISDFLEEEAKSIIAKPRVFQLVELGQPIDFSSKLFKKAYLRYMNIFHQLYLLMLLQRHVLNVWWNTKEKRWWRRMVFLNNLR